MGRRAKNHAIDVICREWAKVRRQLLGVDEPVKASEYVGAVKCTLGQRRDLHAGARTNAVDQNWPEVYVGEPRLVNEAYHAMRPELKVVMEVHYLAHAPSDVKAEALYMSPDTYWRNVRDAQSFVEGWLARTDYA